MYNKVSRSVERQAEAKFFSSHVQAQVNKAYAEQCASEDANTLYWEEVENGDEPDPYTELSEEEAVSLLKLAIRKKSDELNAK